MSEPTRVKISKVQGQQEMERHIDNGLLPLYQECFSIAPYFEQYSRADVESMFRDYQKDGFVLLAHDMADNKLIGFVAGVPLDKDPDVLNTVKKIVPDSLDCYYHADIGVAESHRRLGLAHVLIAEAKKQVPTRYYLMRTQENNQASLQAHQKSGFELLKGVGQVIRHERVGGVIDEDSRVFLLYDRRKFNSKFEPELAKKNITIELMRKAKPNTPVHSDLPKINTNHALV